MYIEYNNVKYPCICIPGKTMIYRDLPDDFPAPVSGEINLCADDGFVMRTDNAEAYLRQTFEDGVLVLTNEPEPEASEEIEPTPDPEPSLDERVTVLEAALASTDEAAIEMYETLAALEEVSIAQTKALIELQENMGGK